MREKSKYMFIQWLNQLPAVTPFIPINSAKFEEREKQKYTYKYFDMLVELCIQLPP